MPRKPTLFHYDCSLAPVLSFFFSVTYFMLGLVGLGCIWQGWVEVVLSGNKLGRNGLSWLSLVELSGIELG